MPKMKIKKGDQVIIISGDDKGKTGEVLKAMPKESKVVVAGVNLVKRHTKPSQKSAGGIVTKEAAVHVSNVAIVSPIYRLLHRSCVPHEPCCLYRSCSRLSRAYLAKQ